MILAAMYAGCLRAIHRAEAADRDVTLAMEALDEVLRAHVVMPLASPFREATRRLDAAIQSLSIAE